MLGFISWRMIQFNVFFVHAVRYGSEFVFFFCRQTPNCSSIICWKRIVLSLPSCPFAWMYFYSIDLFIFISESHCSQCVTVVSQSGVRCCQSSNVAVLEFPAVMYLLHVHSNFIFSLSVFFIKTLKELWMILYWIYRSI